MSTPARREATVIDGNGKVISTVLATEEQIRGREDIIDEIPAVGEIGDDVFWTGSEFIVGTVPRLPALATWTQIKAYREKFEQHALTTSYGELDVDTSAMQRLALAVKQFNSLPTVTEGKLAWKMADNSAIRLTHEQLQEMYDEADELRGIRAAFLHESAEAFRAMDPAPTLGYVADISNWI